MQAGARQAISSAGSHVRAISTSWHLLIVRLVPRSPTAQEGSEHLLRRHCLFSKHPAQSIRFSHVIGKSPPRARAIAHVRTLDTECRAFRSDRTQTPAGGSGAGKKNGFFKAAPDSTRILTYAWQMDYTHSLPPRFCAKFSLDMATWLVYKLARALLGADVVPDCG